MQGNKLALQELRQNIIIRLVIKVWNGLPQTTIKLETINLSDRGRGNKTGAELVCEVLKMYR